MTVCVDDPFVLEIQALMGLSHWKRCRRDFIEIGKNWNRTRAMRFHKIQSASCDVVVTRLRVGWDGLVKLIIFGAKFKIADTPTDSVAALLRQVETELRQQWDGPTIVWDWVETVIRIAASVLRGRCDWCDCVALVLRRLGDNDETVVGQKRGRGQNGGERLGKGYEKLVSHITVTHAHSFPASTHRSFISIYTYQHYAS